MKDIKNYIIAILAGLLVLTLTTQTFNGVTNSSVKTIQYERCLDLFIAATGRNQGATTVKQIVGAIPGFFLACDVYKP